MQNISLMSTAVQRRLPVGAEVCPGGGTHFRLWAPRHQQVEVVLERSGSFPMLPEDDGYFSCFVSGAEAGARYQFRLGPGSRLFPDPASRRQPDGPNGPSEVVDSATFRWTDWNWRGVLLEGQVVYEMHIGTFTCEGTWAAAQMHLPALVETGITLLEIMPVAEFPGKFGWGYDGVDLFAPSTLYGTPDDFRGFVDRAHALGLGVILDVVYNHLGPDGNYLREFSDGYFTGRYDNEWGEALNFDGPGAAGVREYFVSNARYWIEEFHLDGLRLDATQQIFDHSPVHILKDIAREARRAAGRKPIVVIGENEPQHAALIRDHGLDALWNDDFHHTARVAMTGRNEAYYSDYRGTPQEFISSFRWGFLYQGQRYHWQNKRRGEPAFDLKPASFVTYIQNHDQIANSVSGERIHRLTSPGRYRAITAILLLGPGTPMLFQGQEFGASTPFLYFADHRRELALQVQQGREAFLRQFPGIAASNALIPPACERGTFEASRLDHKERETNIAAVALHRDLLKLRREDPVFRSQRSDWIHGAVLGPHAFALRFLGGDFGDRLIVVNLGRDLPLTPVPEPLMAGEWSLVWSSESPKYGGHGVPPVDANGVWSIAGESAAVMTLESGR